MIDAQGIITAADGDHAIVRMDETGCGRCHEDGGCGGNNLGKMFCSAPRTFRVLNPGKLPIDQRVTVVIAEGAVRRGALLGYGLPLLLLFVGAFTGAIVADDLGSIVGAVGGLASAWLILRYAQLHGTPNQRFEPYIRH